MGAVIVATGIKKVGKFLGIGTGKNKKKIQRDRENAQLANLYRAGVPASPSNTGVGQAAKAEQAKLSNKKPLNVGGMSFDIKKMGIAVLAVLALVFAPKLLGKKKRRR